VGYCNFRTFYDNTFIPPSLIIDLSKSKKRDTSYEIWVDKPLKKRNKKKNQMGLLGLDGLTKVDGTKTLAPHK
jgi:hypothetical protein